MISRGPARRPIVLRAVPISSRGSGRLPVPSQESVAVFLRDPEQSVRTVGAELASGFGLTPREASLADLLARNLSLAEAADALGITLGNARIHLKRIFAKTNTRRQAELVSLILRLQV
jgi:DNA-binding CsgD family transcriptional regulator